MRDTFLKSVEGVNTSGVIFCWILTAKMVPCNIFFFRLANVNLNHNFARVLTPLNQVAIPYFTDFIL